MKIGNTFKRIKKYLLEIKGELKKVTWPTKHDIHKTTIAVLISSAIFGIYLFVVDFSFKKLIDKIIEMF